MSPAFSSTRQAGAFAVFLLVLLVLPALFGPRLLPPAGEVYSSLSWRLGAYPYLQHEVFEDKRDIDIAFIGSSHIRLDIDTPQVQRALSQKLGRPAVVVSLCWGWHGMDALYFLTRELLRNRKVHLIVFYDDCGTNTPHREAWRWVRFGTDEPELAGLPLREKVYYYYGAVIGMPRNLVDLLRNNLPADLSPEHVQALEKENDYTLSSKVLGSEPVRMGYDWRPDLFAPYTVQTGAQPSDAVVYSDQTAKQFDFAGPTAPPLQVYFARKFVGLAKAHQTPLALLLLPSVPEARDSIMRDSPLWPASLDGNATILGFPPNKLFSGLSDAQVLALFTDDTHLNQTGQEYYTRLITPSLIQLYETQAKP